MEGRAFKTAGKPRGKPRANRAGKASQICGVRVNRKPPARKATCLYPRFTKMKYMSSNQREKERGARPPLSLSRCRGRAGCNVSQLAPSASSPSRRLARLCSTICCARRRSSRPVTSRSRARHRLHEGGGRKACERVWGGGSGPEYRWATGCCFPPPLHLAPAASLTLEP